MPRRCTICDHHERAAIDLALAGGEANRRIAARFSLSEASIRRHKAAHVPAHLAQGVQAQEVSHADDLLAQIGDLQRQAQAIKDKAEKTGDLKTALTGIRELVRIVELLAKLRSQLDERPVINVLLSPQWIQTRTLLLRTLAPYPEAGVVVARAIAVLERGDVAHSH